MPARDPRRENNAGSSKFPLDLVVFLGRASMATAQWKATPLDQWLTSAVCPLK
jgi:hypothetical protein